MDRLHGRLLLCLGTGCGLGCRRRQQAPEAEDRAEKFSTGLIHINYCMCESDNLSSSETSEWEDKKMKKVRIPVVAAVSAIAVGAILTTPFWSDLKDLAVGAAYAADTGSGSQGQGSGNQGGQGQGSKGSQAGQGNQGGSGAGQGGPDPESDSNGPQAGGPATTGSSGGRPAWSQDGIPEVELGRLNVARSPAQVLQRAFDEALAGLSPEMIDFYSMNLDDMILELSTNWDNVTLLDSPLQNLALFQDALDGTSVLTTLGVTNSTDTLLATFLGVASDKAVPISSDTVVAVSTILGTPITGTAADDLAADAEAIRIAILAGHG